MSLFLLTCSTRGRGGRKRAVQETHSNFRQFSYDAPEKQSSVQVTYITEVLNFKFIFILFFTVLNHNRIIG